MTTVNTNEVLEHINGHLSALSELLHDAEAQSPEEEMALEVMTKMLDEGYVLQDMHLGLEAMFEDSLK